MLNLFQLKDGQRPCIDDVSIEKHLSLCGELEYQIHHLNSGLEAVNARGEGESPSTGVIS